MLLVRALVLAEGSVSLTGEYYDGFEEVGYPEEPEQPGIVARPAVRIPGRCSMPFIDDPRKETA